MKKKIFVISILLLAFASNVSFACNRKDFDKRKYEVCNDAENYRESAIVSTLVANALTSSSKNAGTVSVAYFLMENGDVVIIKPDVKGLILPFTEDEAKMIMMADKGEKPVIIYLAEK